MIHFRCVILCSEIAFTAKHILRVPKAPCASMTKALFQAQVGDVLIGLPSSGVHSNGFSLVRRVLANLGVSLQDPAPWDSATTMGMLQLMKLIHCRTRACIYSDILTSSL